MDQGVNPYEKLDSYVRDVETKERQRRTRTLVFLAGLLALSAAGLIYMRQRPEPPARPVVLARYSWDSLDVAKVSQILADSQPFIAYHPVIGWDTVHTLDEFIDLEGLLAETLAPPAPQPVPTFTVSVEGESIVGEELIYAIEPYDSSYIFVLDFGNGILRDNAGPVETYRYPLPGHFDMHLMLVTDDSAQIVQTLKYEIRVRPDSMQGPVPPLTARNTEPADSLGLMQMP
ncbi:MAG: hypothetical protein OHK0039_41420 [Bacteroidia bacterium]